MTVNEIHGRFISFEGSEGAGKSTAIERVHELLNQANIPVCLTREPGGTKLAEQLREVLLAHRKEPLDAVTETLLMFAARSHHVSQVIRPALARGEWVLCDRFTDATRAYQGAGRGVSMDWIDALESQSIADCKPDLTLLFDLPVEVGLARIDQDRDRDRFESEALSFFERVRAGYLETAQRFPERITIVDAGLAPEQVLDRVLDIIRRRYPNIPGESL